MTNLILQPAGNADSREHYQDTVKSLVRIKDIEHLLSGEEKRRLEINYPNGEFSCWGVTPSNKKKWEKIERGDVTFFSRSGRIFARATTTFKSQNERLARHLWDENAKGDTWECMYFISEVEELDIPYPVFNRVVGYKPNFVIQGFNVLQGDKATNVLSHFGFFSSTFLPEVSKEELASILPSMEETEREATVKTRKEQAYLRRALFGDKVVESCACCGEQFPVSMLVTAHIKKRSYCSHEERLDTSVVLAMCKFGCDELYENGYIVVSNGGVIQANEKPSTDAVNARVNALEGRKMVGFSDANKPYFEWHRQHHQA